MTADIFSPQTVAEAQAVILTPEGGRTPQERWTSETPWLAARIAEEMPGEGRYSTLLDYGCGIGRMMSAIGCPAGGMDGALWYAVDASPQMLALGAQRIGHGVNAAWMTPRTFLAVVQDTDKPFLDGAIAIWALQHIAPLDFALRTIRDALRTGAPFCVLNSDRRWLPRGPAEPWYDDGLDVWARLDEHFTLCHEIALAGSPIYPAGRKFRIYTRP